MRIGAESTVITPLQAAELAGYGYFLHRMAMRVESPLVASALTFEEDGQRAALCSADVISVGEETVAKVSERVNQRLGGDAADATILINASHTHSGPASRRLWGAGGYSPGYVDEILVPRLADTIVSAFSNASEGEIGVERSSIEGLSYNRVDTSRNSDSRVTVIRTDTERRCVTGAHFPCHPVVQGKESTAVSSDYPGEVRATLHQASKADGTFWLTGCCGDINPIALKNQGQQTPQIDKAQMGAAIGTQAARLRQIARTAEGSLRLSEASVDVPIDMTFELDPVHETEVYREAHEITRSQDLSLLRHWFEIAAPIVNENQAETVAIPITLIAIGKLVFAGFGAEIYSETGRAIENKHPDLEIVTMMTSNEHQGYVPPFQEYEAATYATRFSAFIFGRKPLTADSEQIFQTAATSAIAALSA